MTDTAAARTTKLGRDLVVGDIIEGWVPDDLNRITGLAPYVGPLSYLWHGEARTATLAGGRLSMGMTIDPDARYEVVEV